MILFIQILFFFVLGLRAYGQSSYKLNDFSDLNASSSLVEVPKDAIAESVGIGFSSQHIKAVSENGRWILTQRDPISNPKHPFRIYEVAGNKISEVYKEFPVNPEPNAYPVFRGDEVIYTVTKNGEYYLYNYELGPDKFPTNSIANRIKNYNVVRYNLSTNEEQMITDSMIYNGSVISITEMSAMNIQMADGTTLERDPNFANNTHFDEKFNYGIKYTSQGVIVSDLSGPIIEKAAYLNGREALQFMTDGSGNTVGLYFWSLSFRRLTYFNFREKKGIAYDEFPSWINSQVGALKRNLMFNQNSQKMSWLGYDSSDYGSWIVTTNPKDPSPQITSQKLTQVSVPSAVFPENSNSVCYVKIVGRYDCYDMQNSGLKYSFRDFSKSQGHFQFYRLSGGKAFIVTESSIKLISTQQIQVPKIGMKKSLLALDANQILSQFITYKPLPKKPQVTSSIYDSNLKSIDLDTQEAIEFLYKMINEKSELNIRERIISQTIWELLADDKWKSIKAYILFRSRFSKNEELALSARLFYDLSVQVRDLIFKTEFSGKNKILEKLKKELTAELEVYKSPGSLYGVTIDRIKELLTSMGSAMSLFTLAEKEQYADWMAERLVEYTAARDPLIQQMFTSKVYKFTYNALLPYFQIKPKNLVDLTVALDTSSKRLQLVRVTSVQENSNPINGAGFYTRVLSSVDSRDYEELFEQNFRWKTGTQFFHGHVQIKKDSKSASIVSEKLSPAYDEYLKDHILKGVLVVGSNMSEGKALVGNYIKYFSEMGFQFTQYYQVKDTKAYLKEQMSGAEPMDYFIKEAHSDGDEKNLFRIPTVSVLYRAEKKMGNQTEVIELLHADPGSSAAELVSNQDFADWMRQRIASHNTEIMYINGSCWSDKKAVFEVASAKSPKFLNIPATTVTYTFSNDPANGLRTLITALREQKTFAEIRQALESSKYYASYKGDRFIFPDQQEYKDKITNYLPENVDIQIQIQQYVQSKWQPYTLDHHVDENLKNQ